jgi:hypothetical protein
MGISNLHYWSAPDLDEMLADEAGKIVFREISGLVEKF